MERRLQEMKVQKVLVQEEFGPSPYERRQHVQAVTGLLMGSVQRDIYRKEKKPPYAQGAA
jgi:SHS2 domain-containing protein